LVKNLRTRRPARHLRRYSPAALALLLALAIWQGLEERSGAAPRAPGARPDTASASLASDAARILAAAYREGRSDVQVQGTGRVVKVLADDTRGSRHQRFILELTSGQTVLVAHNIDLAPRIDGLARGDVVGFHGEYEWNDRGGVLHWTHHDPRGAHIGGWLEHRGRRYE
jgi:hypothetical protein